MSVLAGSVPAGEVVEGDLHKINSSDLLSPDPVAVGQASGEIQLSQWTSISGVDNLGRNAQPEVKNEDLQSFFAKAAEEAHWSKLYSLDEVDRSESRKSDGSDEAAGSEGENSENHTEFNDLDEENTDNFCEEPDTAEKKEKSDALDNRVENMSIEDLTSSADEGDQTGVGKEGGGGGPLLARSGLASSSNQFTLEGEDKVDVNSHSGEVVRVEGNGMKGLSGEAQGRAVDHRVPEGNVFLGMVTWRADDRPNMRNYIQHFRLSSGGATFRFTSLVTGGYYLSIYQQVLFTTSDRDEILKVTPYLEVCKPPQELRELIAHRTIIPGVIKGYATGRDRTMRGHITPTPMVSEVSTILFLKKHLISPVDVTLFPPGTRVLFATSVPHERFDGKQHAAVVNIMLDPEFVTRKFENLLMPSAAVSLQNNLDMSIDLFLGEELGALPSSPFLDYPTSLSYLIDRNPEGVIKDLISKARKLYLDKANSTEGRDREKFLKKEKEFRTKKLNILINPYNWPKRSALFWLGAISAYKAEPDCVADRIFLLTKLIHGTSLENFRSLNDSAQYTDPRSQCTTVEKIYLVPDELRFRRFDEIDDMIVDGKSESSHACCFVEHSGSPHQGVGEIQLTYLSKGAPLPEEASDMELAQHALEEEKKGAGQKKKGANTAPMMIHDWTDSLIVCHYMGGPVPLPFISKRFLPYNKDDGNGLLVRRLLHNLAKESIPLFLSSLTGASAFNTMVCDAKEWYSPSLPWLAIVHTKPGTNFATVIRRKIVCRLDAQMGPMHGSDRVVRVICKDIDEQERAIAKIQEAHQKAKSSMKSLPFVGFYTSQSPNVLRSLGALTRLPEQYLGAGAWREARGRGFVYLQGVPYYLSESNKVLLLTSLGVVNPREAQGFFVRCVGQAAPVVRILVEERYAFNHMTPLTYDSETGKFGPASPDCFQGCVFSPAIPPSGDVLEMVPLFRTEFPEPLVDSELLVALSHDQWAANNRDEAELMTLLRDMPDAIEEKDQVLSDLDEEASPEPVNQAKPLTKAQVKRVKQHAKKAAQAVKSKGSSSSPSTPALSSLAPLPPPASSASPSALLEKIAPSRSPPLSILAAVPSSSSSSPHAARADDRKTEKVAAAAERAGGGSEDSLPKSKRKAPDKSVEGKREKSIAGAAPPPSTAGGASRPTPKTIDAHFQSTGGNFSSSSPSARSSSSSSSSSSFSLSSSVLSNRSESGSTSSVAPGSGAGGGGSAEDKGGDNSRTRNRAGVKEKSFTSLKTSTQSKNAPQTRAQKEVIALARGRAGFQKKPSPPLFSDNQWSALKEDVAEDGWTKVGSRKEQKNHSPLRSGREGRAAADSNDGGGEPFFMT